MTSDAHRIRPTISLVVLTFDRPDKLRRCLASLLAQRCSAPLEVIVADDGSGPETAEVVRSMTAATDVPVRHLRHEGGAHRGIPATRNLGVSAASGDYVAIVADDYVLRADYVAVALDYLQSHSDASVVRFDLVPTTRHLGARVSHHYYAEDIRRRLESEGLTAEEARRGVMTRTLEAAGAAVFRRQTLADVGPYDEALQRGEDTEHSARLRAAGHRIHVLMSGTVGVEYSVLPVDTMRKCFLSGFYRPRLGSVTTPPRPSWSSRLRHLGHAARAAQIEFGVVPGLVGYVPFLVLFRTATGAGYRAGARSLRRSSTVAADRPLAIGHSPS